MTSADTGGAVVVYLDYVCPFSYVGWQVLIDVRGEVADPPPLSVRPVDTRGYKRGDDDELDHAIDDEVGDAPFERTHRKARRVADDHGVDLVASPDPRADGWNAHLAAGYVFDRYPDRFQTFVDAVFEAYWRDRRDITDPAVLTAVADEIGVPGAGVRDAFDDETRATHLRAAFADAREANVNSAPTFVYRGERMSGVDPSEDLRRTLREWFD
jgi:predicted DsbA family dithiol-disulfide isomerase